MKPQKRSKIEIDKQIKLLKSIAAKPTFRKITFFGDNNKDAIEAQIETLERDFDVDTVYNREGEEWTCHAAESARDAALWAAGESDDTPADGWKGLY